jgi:hypothetical protein
MINKLMNLIIYLVLLYNLFFLVGILFFMETNLFIFGKISI